MRGDIIWQRPTFTWPVAILSSAQQRFTSVFGMGTGGATVPWSPDLGSRGLVRGGEPWSDDARLRYSFIVVLETLCVFFDNCI